MRIFTSFFCVLLLVGGVSGVEKKKVTLSVMKGDTVTLSPDDAEIQTGDPILWKFEGSIIGKRKTDGSISTYDGPGGISKDKLLLDKQTGSLTITDLTTDHTGLYQLEIKSTTEIFKKYSVTVSGTGGVKTRSVKEGEIIILNTGVINIDSEGYNLILWKTKDIIVGEINKKINRNNGGQDIFNGRQQLNENSGSLTISDSRTTDSGVYHLTMSSSSHTLQRTITVTVRAQSGAPSGICGAGVGLVVWALTVFLLQEV
uniref:Si:dkey-182g1.6 n=1 Tax=Cyprinus carpio TaxID=7962 RepID=A0A8C2EF57_CYPCA